ncbi:hypothetical protein ACH3WN_32360 [Streptomyces albogriseolus]|uniref:hypothetical protein n=1 Tax=Streptomyces albogriseolus TaxID=1887 RepID=UPI0037AB75D2
MSSPQPVRAWDEPEGIAPHGTLVVLPGRGEHGGVYERFGRRIAADGYPAWQVRVGDATALSLADPGLADPNADIRKAAVAAPTRHRATRDARAAVATATRDPDADVRAYAARAL